MCGRFAASSSAEELLRFFEIDEADEELPPPAYNIAPTDPIAVVVERQPAAAVRRRLTSMRWGLVPSWSRDARGAARLINARVETVAEKPSFRRALAARRCLVPADGYYEWYASDTQAVRPAKQPYFIRSRSGDPLAMAGLYEFWKAPDGTWLSTATIITSAAVDAVGRLHDRMPMTVPAEHWGDWLDPAGGAEALGLLSVPSAELTFYPVSTAVNNVANDGPQLLAKIALGE